MDVYALDVDNVLDVVKSQLDSGAVLLLPVLQDIYVISQ